MLAEQSVERDAQVVGGLAMHLSGDGGGRAEHIAARYAGNGDGGSERQGRKR